MLKKFNLLNVKSQKESYSHCKLLLSVCSLVSLSAFEISFSFFLEFSLSSCLVLSLTFSVLSV